MQPQRQPQPQPQPQRLPPHWPQTPPPQDPESGCRSTFVGCITQVVVVLVAIGVFAWSSDVLGGILALGILGSGYAVGEWFFARGEAAHTGYKPPVKVLWQSLRGMAGILLVICGTVGALVSIPGLIGQMWPFAIVLAVVSGLLIIVGRRLVRNSSLDEGP